MRHLIKNFIERNFGINKKIVFENLKKNGYTRYCRHVKPFLKTVISRNPRRYNIMLINRINKVKKRILGQLSWKGFMMKNKLPLNGQRTHTNAKTHKSKKK